MGSLLNGLLFFCGYSCIILVGTWDLSMFRGGYSVGTNISKEDYLKIRIKKDLKQEFKKIAEINKTNMSEVILKYIEGYVQNNKINVEHKEIIDKRIVTTDKKLIEIKERLTEKRESQNKKKWYVFRK